MSGNDVIDLGGSWSIRADPEDAGLDDAWFRTPAVIGGQTIMLPAPTQAVLGANFHAPAWFRRRVRVPKVRRGRSRIWMRFRSVATDCRVWIDGEAVGHHVGDWVPFQFDVTDAVAGRDAVDIVIRVDEIHAPRAPEGELQRGYITKGFHDVISIQHGGIWQPFELMRTGLLCATADDITAHPAADRTNVRVEVDLEPGHDGGWFSARVSDLNGARYWTGSKRIAAGDTRVEVTVRVVDVEAWSPQTPRRFSVHGELKDRGGRCTCGTWVGFRTIRTDGDRILLNDQPIRLRGVLDWGHEPRHIAPAPTMAEVRSRFATLRSMGFNTVCVCMWYAPRSFYEIADATGMLVWQEHPVWQSRMDDEDVEAYKRHYASFMRRDARHPSVALVSATCEHPSFHPELGAWWWSTARERLPQRLLQLQTAFFKWTDHERTDLYDEHTYDNPNRWPAYLRDLDAHLEDLPTKPFVMGETILFTSWPNVAALEARVGDDRPWWLPRCFDERLRIEKEIADRYGRVVTTRMRRDADRMHWLGRRFEVECLRATSRQAGFVMNHLNDVPACQCGFRDDLDVWRFEAGDVTPWLGDTVVVLRTPDDRRAFTADERLRGTLRLVNDGPETVGGNARVRAHSDDTPEIGATVSFEPCGPGGMADVEFDLPLARRKTPTRHDLTVALDGATPTGWSLWSFQVVERLDGASRLDGAPFTDADRAVPEVEAGYSRGWGLAARSWAPRLPDPARLAAELQAWDPGALGIVVTHRLTDDLLTALRRGARVVLLASAAAESIPTAYASIYGCVPLVLERGPLAAGDAAWVVDLLGYDLLRSCGRVIESTALGIADAVDPIVRLFCTHDCVDHIPVFDVLAATRVGEGVLVMSAIDHEDPPGRWMLQRIIEWLGGDVEIDAEVRPDVLRAIRV